MSDRSSFSHGEAQKIGEELGIDWSIWDVDQFKRGLDVELEHGSRDLETNVSNDDALITGKIALTHLKEIPDYYDRLAKMEQEGEKYWDEKRA